VTGLLAGLATLLLCAPMLVAQPPGQASEAPASAAPAASGPETAARADQPLPAPTEILSRYVEALGGEDAIRRHRHLTWKGTFAMPGMGLEGKILLQASAPNLFRLEIVTDAMGTITQGYDGKVGWSDNPMTGPTLMEGGELEMTAIQSDFYVDLNFAEHYPEIEVVGRETYSGEEAYKLSTTTAGGLQMFQYFSVASGLLLGAEGDLPTPMGEVWVKTEIGGYREFDGRLYPTENRQDAMGSQQVLKVVDVDFGEIDPAVYALPEAIRTLVGGQQAQ
jgi:hypothetical protein